MMLLGPSPGGRRLPRGWKPPRPFRIVVVYSDPERRRDLLWVTGYLERADGTRMYLAAGPAGQPVAAHLIRAIDLRAVPAGADVVLVTEHNAVGELVYGMPNHTLN